MGQGYTSGKYTSGAPIDTDATLTANSDKLVASQKAVKTFAIAKSTLTTAEDLLIQRGGIPTRLPVGAEGSVPKIVGGLIVWTFVALAVIMYPSGDVDAGIGIILAQSPITSTGNPT